MAGRHLVGLFGNFWHHCHHCLIVRAQNNQARGVGLDMVAVARVLAGVALYSDQQAIDSTTPMGRAKIQMASVFGEQERQIIRSRVVAGLNRVREQGKKLGRPMIGGKVEDAIVVICVGLFAPRTIKLVVLAWIWFP